ncbi:hypothetical protein MTO96_005097 [Rhipicephalus appendiculatus]
MSGYYPPPEQKQGYPQAPMPGAMPGAVPGAVPGAMPYDPPPPYTPTAPNPCHTAQPMDHPSRLSQACHSRLCTMSRMPLMLAPASRIASLPFLHLPLEFPPNAAQLAAMQGNPVVLGQKKNNFWTTGAGGGYTFW